MSKNEFDRERARGRSKLYFSGCAVLGACTAQYLLQHWNLQIDRYRYQYKGGVLSKEEEQKRNK